MTAPEQASHLSHTGLLYKWLHLLTSEILDPANLGLPYALEAETCMQRGQHLTVQEHTSDLLQHHK
jgi:hypothetical protein